MALSRTVLTDPPTKKPGVRSVFPPEKAIQARVTFYVNSRPNTAPENSEGKLQSTPAKAPLIKICR
jgi:hypothetical protein